MPSDHPETWLLRELAADWAQLNRLHFHRVLRQPLLSLTDAPRTLGSWDRQSRTLQLSRALVTGQRWGVVIEVLKHEMAHQYVDEVLHAHDEPAHGPAFQAICQRLAIDPAASGLPEGAVAPQRARLMRRVQRLLALSSSPNAHEAQSAARAARRLMLRHNLSTTQSRYGFRQLGAPSKRRPLHCKLLAAILIDHFFVTGIWVGALDVSTGRRGRVLELHGTPENLEVAGWMHGFLLESAERLWSIHKSKRKLTSNRSRRAFLAGVMMGVRKQLDDAARIDQETGLVWVASADLSDYLHRRHPQRQAARRSTITTGEALHHGQRAGRDLELRSPIGAGDGPRLLSGQ